MCKHKYYSLSTFFPDKKKIQLFYVFAAIVLIFQFYILYTIQALFFRFFALFDKFVNTYVFALSYINMYVLAYGTNEKFEIELNC